MIWIFRICFVLLYLVIFDLLYGLVGLLFVRCDPIKHPRVYRFGLRHIAMSTFFCKSYLPAKCVYDCSVVKCGNWTCPKYPLQKKKNVFQ